MRRLKLAARLGSLVAAAALASSIEGCAAHDQGVARVVDGRTIVGRWIAPEAYQGFLRGAIAEASGNLDEAIAAYDEVSRVDGDDPEVFARVAAVRCRKSKTDPAAKVALERAFALDAGYGPAFEARAACGGGPDDLSRAAAAEPRWLPLQIAAANQGAPEGTESALLSITARFAVDPAAWEALATWAFAHGLRPLGVHAAVELVRLSPSRAALLHRFTLALAGDGATLEARRVAAAAVDARDDVRRGGAAAPPPLVARLAIDEALLRGDASTALHRGAAGRVPSAEIAARALLVGAREVAASLAKTLVAADAADGEAGLVSVALAPGVGTAPPVTVTPVSRAACVAYLRAVARRDGTTSARTSAASLHCEPSTSGDSLVSTLEADLAAREIVTEASLGIEARVELAARRGDAGGAVDEPRIDRRHSLLAAALRGEAVPLGATDDPLLVAAQLISLRKRSLPTPEELRAHAESIAHDDPLLVAALFAVTPPDRRPALRARLLALAATEAERRLARD